MSIKFENTKVMGWDDAIRSLTHMHALDESDSGWFSAEDDMGVDFIGPNDLDRMKHMRNTLEKYRTLMKMITVYVNITAPIYFWKEFDMYKVETVADSGATMHKILEKEFTLKDFSCEHLLSTEPNQVSGEGIALATLETTIRALNFYRKLYLETKDKKYWYQIIQLLPISYNQKWTVKLNYGDLIDIYLDCKDRELDEWREHKESTCPVNETTICCNPKEFLLCEDCFVGKGFCDWIKTLPYSELII